MRSLLAFVFGVGLGAAIGVLAGYEFYACHHPEDHIGVKVAPPSPVQVDRLTQREKEYRKAMNR
jgi:hypothetical protein